MALFGSVFSGSLPSPSDLSRKFVLRTARRLIAEEKSSARRRLIRRAAHDFSRYLNEESPLGVDPEEEAIAAEEDAELTDLEHMEAALRNTEDSDERGFVSANLLSSNDYLTAVKAAYEEDPSGELALIIMLGFRTGLRLREILGLQTCDVLARDDFSPELHLRHNAIRNLKTYHSRRIIPLNSFLTGRETKALLNWLAVRKSQINEAETTSLLFGPTGARALPDERGYERKIEDVLGKSCSPRLTFSHLRHSFSSYLMLTLLLPSAESEKLVPRRMRNLVTWERKWWLQKVLIGKDRMGQGALHAVSQLMGHTGILRTLESYQHLLSLAVGLYTNRQLTLPHLPSEVISRLWPKEKASVNLPHVLGPTVYWNRVAASLKQLPARVEDYRPLIARTYPKEDGGKFYLSSIKERAREPLQSESSSRIGWRLLLDLAKSSDAAARASAATLGLSGGYVARLRGSYEQVTRSVFKPGALPHGLAGPRGRQAESVVDRIWSQLPAEPTDDEKRLLTYFLNNFRPKRYHGVFAELSDAIAFAAFLRKIGFSADHIFIAVGHAAKIQSYKSNPTSLVPELEGTDTLYRRPADLMEMVKATLGPSGRRHPVVLWFRFIKFERDAMGLSFDTRSRLDAAQARHDERLISAGKELSPARASAKAKREERAAKDSARLHSTILPPGNKAYRLSLLLAAIYYGLELEVLFPEGPQSHHLKSRDRRFASQRSKSAGKRLSDEEE
jgi:integrase